MRLVVSETASAVWFYHFREVKEDKLFPSGGAPAALCGAKLGWDTAIPVQTYGKKDHIPSRWCRDCAAIAGVRCE